MGSPPATVRLRGAASVVESLVAPHRAAVEAATGLSLEVEKSNAGRGLRDLVEGRCDAALAAASLEATVAAARSAGLEGPVPDLRLVVVATSEVVFAVHPSNPVKALSREQLRGLHTGEIASWREVGGADLPVAVYTDAPASATRGLVQQVVLEGRPYAPGARAVERVALLNDAVAADPAGIGALGLEIVDRARVAVVHSPRLERPLAFATLGEPSGPVARVIEAFRAAARAGRT
jgi:phosphate transport system substrate-binding protein